MTVQTAAALLSRFNVSASDRKAALAVLAVAAMARMAPDAYSFWAVNTADFNFEGRMEAMEELGSFFRKEVASTLRADLEIEITRADVQRFFDSAAN